jgi:uncharacterized protein (TIGR03086 family)
MHTSKPDRRAEARLAVVPHSAPQTAGVDARFAALVEALSPLDGVTIGSGRRGFGADALCADGRIFAIPRPSGLVLKLPSQRVAKLIATGDGLPFDAGKGRPMKEWVTLGLLAEERWLQLAHEALAFANPVYQLAIALDATERVLTAVRDHQWADPTPCTEWQVRDLVNHLVGGNYTFARILRGEPPAPPRQVLQSGPELQSAYRDSAAAVLGAFRQPDVLEHVFTVPFGTVPGMVALHLRITEVLVHGWDLAQATAQPATFPDDLAEQALAFTRGKLPDVGSGRSPFAPPQPVAEDASAIDRLAACLGRSVAAAAPASRRGS